jgi:homopolymeric O-antigen transport system ATP-binding protein
MKLIRELCPRAIFLRHGRMVIDGRSEDAISQYLEGVISRGRQEITLVASAAWPDDLSAPGSDRARLLAVRALTPSGAVAERHSSSDPFSIEMAYRVLQDGDFLVPSFHFFDARGDTYMILMDADTQRRARPLADGVYTASVRVPGDFLAPGMLRIVAALATPMPRTMHFYQKNALVLEIYESPASSASVRGAYEGNLPGFLRPRLEWDFARLVDGS